MASEQQANTTAGYDPSVGVRQGVRGGSNGYLQTKYDAAKHGKVKLWVQDVSTGFSLNGSVAHSQNTRSFFPRNRVQQSIMVSCQFPNQTLYADAAEWIRKRHLSKATSTVLMIKPTWLPVRGMGDTIHVHGYIKAVERKHERFVYAPEMTIEFLVQQVLSPAGWVDENQDKQQGLRVLQSWREVILNNNAWRDGPDPPPEDPELGDIAEPTPRPFDNPIPGGGMTGPLNPFSSR